MQPASLLAPRVPQEQRTLLRNCVVWTGEEDTEGKRAARPAFPGCILLRGNVVEAVLERGAPEPAADRVVDCGGRAVIPGMVDGHAHPSFEDIVAPTDVGDTPPEEGVLHTLRNCRRLLDAGFTSAFSAAAARVRADVVARNWINAGHAPGPRLRAASPEICSTGCLGDHSAAHQPRESFGLVADGPEAVRRVIRLCVREGVDTVKINIGGDLIPSAKGLGMMTENLDDFQTAYTDAEVKAACEEAHRRGVRVAAHCRGSNDVRLALRHGVDVIYHCDFAFRDPALLSALEDAKDRIFTGPAIGLVDALAPTGLFKPADSEGVPAIGVVLDAIKRTYPELLRRGVPVVIGGDYGFRVTPQGLQANDLELFRTHLGYTAEEALVAATRIGGRLMQANVGVLKPGMLADLLVVDGKPWETPEPLRAKVEADGSVAAPGIHAVMIDGHFHRSGRLLAGSSKM
eukprot:TRINITY_DN12775_c0_g1_i2.p1 TRINITY_DN12775_c0_g1~~TRINITY_DN12775_c0_g1_i2.p1  ORF type:complete len:459 (+),score=137.73 TRINITY_DN12775_c0_g1_i2:61-1437(+)